MLPRGGGETKTGNGIPWGIYDKISYIEVFSSYFSKILSKKLLEV
jgi:hypothetical protein